jgi:Uma2 family endonuclease
MNLAFNHTLEGGPPRRAFSSEDVRGMVDAGVLAEDERIELIGGDLLVMAAKGYAHELIKKALVRAFVLAAADDVDVGVEMTIEFSRDVLLEPDIVIFPRNRLKKSDTGFAQLDGGDCLLVVEVAVSSLNYDKELKAVVYAGLGVREFWVIDANERVAWIHTGPSQNGWASILERGPSETLTTPAVPKFAIRLGDIS